MFCINLSFPVEVITGNLIMVRTVYLLITGAKIETFYGTVR